MENVKGMLKVAEQVVEDYESLHIEKGGIKYSYKVKYQVLNSQDFFSGTEQRATNLHCN